MKRPLFQMITTDNYVRVVGFNIKDRPIDTNENNRYPSSMITQKSAMTLMTLEDPCQNSPIRTTPTFGESREGIRRHVVVHRDVLPHGVAMYSRDPIPIIVKQ